MKEKELINFELIKAIKKANNQILKLESELVKQYDLTSSQYGVLECLYVKGDMCIHELIDRLISTSGTMTVIIKNLEKLGYVTKEHKCEDKRYYNIVLTQKGRKLIEEIFPSRKRLVKDFADTLSEDEKQMLLSILYRFKQRYKEVKND